MLMLGTLLNAAAIVIGALAGCWLRHGLPEAMKKTIMQGLGLTVMLIGISMAIKSRNLLVVTLAMALGAAAGELCRIEFWLDRLGRTFEARFSRNGGGTFSKGFVTASLIYCVGAMAIMGALEAGLTGRNDTLYVKSVLDGISSLVLGSVMGMGVAFSAVPVLLYQGAIALGAGLVKPLLTEPVICEMSATGGLLIFAIGLNFIIDTARIKVGNLLPAILLAAIFAELAAKFP